MILLCILTGLFISLSTPLAYLIWGWYDSKEHAASLSSEIAKQIMLQESPKIKLWKGEVSHILQRLSRYEGKQVSKVKVIDLQGVSIYTQKVFPSAWPEIRGKAEIRFQHKLYGYVVASKQADRLLAGTITLFIIFTLLGVVIAWMLFRFSAKFVKFKEKELGEQFARLHHLSYYDRLTGFFNRTYSYEFVPELIEQSHHKNEQFALLFLDIDNFKRINDSLGHTFGDLLLATEGERLRTAVCERDTIIRLGGDEFMIIVPNIQNVEQAIAVAEKILDMSDVPAIIDEHELFITTSIGISFYPGDGEDMSLLVRNADTAMYAAKSRGKNKYCLYEWSMNRVVMDRLKIEHNIRKALEHEEFQLYFQPKFQLLTKEIVGCEVLLRWNQPLEGWISPDVFIPVAEETGLIIPIGAWVLRKSFQQVKYWVDTYQFEFRFSINLSPLQFKHDKLIPMIHNLLEETGLDPRSVELEITERIGMDDLEQVLHKLNQIQQMGIEISIDDFGTGYSSMSYLNKFPIDTLKIAMPFIQDIHLDQSNEAIVSAIIAMANNLNLKVIAEGIEYEQQIDILIKKGCTMGQGFYFCRPIPADEFIQFVLNWKENAAS